MYIYVYIYYPLVSSYLHVNDTNNILEREMKTLKQGYLSR